MSLRNKPTESKTENKSNSSGNSDNSGSDASAAAPNVHLPAANPNLLSSIHVSDVNSNNNNNSSSSSVMPSGEDVVYRSVFVPSGPVSVDANVFSNFHPLDSSSPLAPMPLLSKNAPSSGSGKPLPSQSSGVTFFVDASVEDHASPVPELPGYYERYTSFSLREHTSAILDGLEHIMSKNQCDYEINRQRYQISGDVYDTIQHAKLNVNIFMKDDHSYLVEFQKQTGDSQLFIKLFQQAREHFSSLITDKPAQGNRAAHVNREPPAMDIVLDESSASPLRSMIECPCVDVCLEGIKMIASCSASPNNHAALHSCLPTLKLLLKSPEVDIARCTALTVANLVQSPNAADAVSAAPSGNADSPSWLDTIFEVLEQSPNMETRRILARVVLSLVRRNPDCVAASSKYLNILKQIRSQACDSRLKDSMATIFAAFDSL